MAKMHVKKGEEVYILTGRDATKKGKVLEVHTKTNRVTVDGINIIKKHQKPRPPSEPEGGIKEKPAPIHVSNVKRTHEQVAKNKAAHDKAQADKAKADKKAAPKKKAK